MIISPAKSILFSVLILGFGIITGSAAVFSLNFGGTTQAIEFDSYYSDSESAIFQRSAHNGNLTASLSGKDYGDDITSNQRWGVLDNHLEWNQVSSTAAGASQLAGGLIRGGFAPEMPGSTIHRSGQETTRASFLSIKVTPSSEMLFENIGLVIEQSQTLCVEPTAWAATSIDNFSTVYFLASAAAGHAETAEWKLNDLQFRTANPVEIRIYGVIGADEGTIPVFQLDGIATPVPETSSSLLVALFGLLGLGRRRN